MADTASPPNPVGWFEIYVSDMARAKKFYATVFQRPLENLPYAVGDAQVQMCVFPMNATSPGASGALVQRTPMRPGAGGTLVYFSCEDCATEAGRVASAGGTVTLPKTSIGEYGFIALVQDSEGNPIGLHSRQ